MELCTKIKYGHLVHPIDAQCGVFAELDKNQKLDKYVKFGENSYEG